MNRPIYNNSAANGNRGKPLSDCGSGGALAAPLCDPATTTGSPTGAQGLTIDATVLALNQSLVVNNYGTSGNEGQLTVYGSIQQDARGPVGLVGGTGYYKYYVWDPRLTLYGPPYYLTPGPLVGPRLLGRDLHRAVCVPTSGPDHSVHQPADLAGRSFTGRQPHQRLHHTLIGSSRTAPLSGTPIGATVGALPTEG